MSNQLVVRFNHYQSGNFGIQIFGDPNEWYEHIRKISNSSKRRDSDWDDWEPVWPYELSNGKQFESLEDYLECFEGTEVTLEDSIIIRKTIFDDQQTDPNEQMDQVVNFLWITDELNDDGVNTDDDDNP